MVVVVQMWWRCKYSGGGVNVVVEDSGVRRMKSRSWNKEMECGGGGGLNL